METPQKLFSEISDLLERRPARHTALAILQRKLHLLKSSYSSIVPHSSALYSTPSTHTSIKIKICLKESFGVKCNVDLKADKWAV